MFTVRLRTGERGMTSLFLAVLMGCALAAPTAHAGDPPDYQGYADTKGGEGGKVIEVTNLDDSGPGSFRQACKDAAAGKCIIVFKVAGTIYPLTTIPLHGSDITVDGSTAPAPGITLNGSKLKNPGHVAGYGPSLQLRIKNTIIQHMRFRDTFIFNMHMTGSDNVILHHVSSTGSSDGAIFINPSTRITLSYCLFGGNALGMRLRGSKMSIHHCLFAQNSQRSPFIQNTPGLWDYRNNVVLNWGNYAVSFYRTCRINMVNNYFGTSVRGGTAKQTIMLRENDNQIYADGNTGPTSGAIPGLVTAKQPFEPLPRVTTQTAEEARKIVLAEAGALPRDEIDKEYAAGTRAAVKGKEVLGFGRRDGKEEPAKGKPKAKPGAKPEKSKDQPEGPSKSGGSKESEK